MRNNFSFFVLQLPVNMRSLIAILLMVTVVTGMAPYYRDAEKIEGRYIIVLKVYFSYNFVTFFLNFIFVGTFCFHSMAVERNVEINGKYEIPIRHGIGLLLIDTGFHCRQSDCM